MSTTGDSSVAEPVRGRWPWGWAPALIVAAHLGLLILCWPARAPLVFFGLLAVAFAGLVLATRSRSAAVPAGIILGVAMLLRALLIPLPPTLAEDAYRAVWDGRVAAAAYDPYVLAPDSRELTPLRGDLYDRFRHHDVPTAAAPLALTLFTVVSRLSGSIWVLKIVLAILDTLTCLLLLRLAERLGVERKRVLWYAWNPLVTLEVAGMAHVEALGVVAVVAAVWYLTARPPRAVAAATAGATAVLAKLLPIVALPLWAVRSRRPGRFLALVALLCGVAFAPVLVAARGLPLGLARYALAWQYNGPLFEPLWRLLEAARVGPGFAAALGGSGVQARLSPELLAKGLLLLPLLVGIARQVRKSDVVAATGATFGWVIIASAAVYPWSLLWVLPFAALRRQQAWLVASGTVLLAYLPHLLHIPYWPWTWVLIWLPFAAMLMRDPRWSID